MSARQSPSILPAACGVPDRTLPSLLGFDASREVAAIRYCGDAYRVVTGDGKTRTLWQFNLRFKTDGSPAGPLAGKPVIVASRMQGDTGRDLFARPEEISAFIRKECL